MKNQDQFVTARRGEWDELDTLLGDRTALSSLSGADISRIARLYRSLCNDLMRCRAARYSSDLDAYLDGLAARAHNLLYGPEPFRFPDIIGFFAHEFPSTLRKNGRFFWASLLLFFLPYAIGLLGAHMSYDFATHVLPDEALHQMKEMYAKGLDGRAEGQDTLMAGFYVYNNVGIAFRCFATGILFCAGSVFFLAYNGLITGTVTGAVMAAGHGGNIWTFMCGHTPFEITAILISGAAGLRMGYALVDTRGTTRVASLRAAAPDLARLVIGAASMLVVAALVEGFWSPSGLPPQVKWGASAVFTLAVIAYLGFAGRGSSSIGAFPNQRGA